MTQEELNALPECATLEYREEMRDGRRVRIAIAKNCFALGDAYVVTDVSGQDWMIGWAKGVCWKKRCAWSWSNSGMDEYRGKVT